jgi:hypothetical protein
MPPMTGPGEVVVFWVSYVVVVADCHLFILFPLLVFIYGILCVLLEVPRKHKSAWDAVKVVAKGFEIGVGGGWGFVGCVREQQGR